jgi:periplasmic divalent cation tolerance protein
MKNSFVIVLVTFGSKREAELVADSLLRKRLVACANITDKIVSKFWWNGRIDKASEALVIFKTSGNNFKAVEKEVKRLHSYEVPEIIAIPIVAISVDYKRWINDNVK